MTPNEVQLKIDRIISKSFQPTRDQKKTSILMIVHSLGFEAVLAHALKAKFNCSDILELTDDNLDELFEIARTWRYQADRNSPTMDRKVVVNMTDGD